VLTEPINSRMAKPDSQVLVFQIDDYRVQVEGGPHKTSHNPVSGSVGLDARSFVSAKSFKQIVRVVEPLPMSETHQ
jgi:hypothetical protein